jgi:hypothetical protein
MKKGALGGHSIFSRTEKPGGIPGQPGFCLLTAPLKVYSALSWQRPQVQRYRAPMIRDTLYKTYLISAGAVTVAWTGLFMWIVAGAFGL